MRTISIGSFAFEMLVVSVILIVTFLLIKKKASPKFIRIFLFSIYFMAIGMPLLQIEDVVTREINTSTTSSGYLSKNIDSQVLFQPAPLMHTETDVMSSTVQPAQVDNSLDLVENLVIAYFVVVLLLLSKMAFSLSKIWSLKRNGKQEVSYGIRYLRVQDSSLLAASFWKTIFIGEQVTESSLQKTLLHEKTHVDKLHSLDALISEIFCALFWINPIFLITKSRLKLNSEFEVDELMSNQFGSASYKEFLLDLKLKRSPSEILSFLSAKSIKARFNKMDIQNRISWRIVASCFLVYSSTIWIAGCNDPFKESIVTAEGIRDIKTITTRYESHQSDTHQKDRKVVAIAEFNPNGTIVRYDQHMTYPYDMKHPVEWKFWSEPVQSGLLVAMDGLSLEHAENNFIYGHDWPKLYAAEPPISTEYGRFEKKVFSAPNGLPSQIINESYNQHWIEGAGVEDFEYVDENVFRHHYWRKIDMGLYLKEIDYNGPSIPDSTTIYDAKYEYDNENLISVNWRWNKFLFYYEGNNLIKTEYYLRGKMYNYRTYHYDDSGLKRRTEIFNVDGQAEYTIHYEYEFYSESED